VAAIVLDGAPSDLLEFFKAHPDSNINEAIAELKLHRSTAFYALSRLYELQLIEQGSRRRKGHPRRWKAAEEAGEPVLEQPAALGVPPEIRRQVVLLQPTGVPYTVVEGRIQPLRGELQIFTVVGPRGKAEVDASRPTHHRVNAGDHPWGPGPK
jgi:hypothetical protein